MPKDLEYYAKRGYLGQEHFDQTHSMPSTQAQENMAVVSQAMGGPGAQAQPVNIPKDTNVAADQRMQQAQQKLQQMIDSNQMTQEQAAQIMSRWSPD